MTSIAIRRSLHPKSLCETVRYARSVPHGPPCSPARSNRLPDEISVVEPPDPIPNSEVKRNSADGSVGFPCESRSSSGFYTEAPSQKLGASSLRAGKLGQAGGRAEYAAGQSRSGARPDGSDDPSALHRSGREGIGPGGVFMPRSGLHTWSLADRLAWRVQATKRRAGRFRDRPLCCSCDVPPLSVAV